MLDDWDVPAYRLALRRRARALKIDPRVQVRFDDSDLVQETLLRASDPARAGCTAETEAERIAWLFAIQERVLLDKYDEQFAQKRDPRREVAAASLQKAFVDSTAEFLPQAASREADPADEAGLREEAAILDDLLVQMPDELREVLAAKREGLTLAETATRLGVTSGVVAGRLVKATKLLLAMTRKLRDEESP